MANLPNFQKQERFRFRSETLNRRKIYEKINVSLRACTRAWQSSALQGSGSPRIFEYKNPREDKIFYRLNVSDTLQD